MQNNTNDPILYLKKEDEIRALVRAKLKREEEEGITVDRAEQFRKETENGLKKYIIG